MSHVFSLHFMELLPLNSEYYWTIQTIRENIRYKVWTVRAHCGCLPPMIRTSLCGGPGSEKPDYYLRISSSQQTRPRRKA
jgi:hypothetical protein